MTQPSWSPPDVDPFQLNHIRRAIHSHLFQTQLPQTKLWGGEVVGLLGRGGMGSVYKVYDAKLDRHVAVKLLDRDGQQNTLLAEAKAMAQVSHPNVIQVFDAGLHEGQVFIVMEYIEGESLRHWLAEKRPPEQILATFAMAGRGLQAIHKEGIVHRDFKPGNVLVGSDGQVKIIDFGIALHTAELPSSPMAGTLAYMSPEQLRGESLSPATDQFSFCTALLQALTGQHPFLAQTQLATVTRISTASIDSSLLERLPRRLRRTIKRGLASDPQDRFPDMDALLLALVPPGQRHRVLWLLGTLSVSAAALVSVAEGSSEPFTCGNFHKLVQRYWSPDVQRQLHQSLDTEQQSLWEPLTTRLDTYLAEWVNAKQDACTARADHLISPLRYEQISTCLQRGLRAVDLVVGNIRYTGALEPTLNAVEELPVASLCLNEPVVSTNRAQELNSIRSDLNEADVYRVLGEYEIATEIVEGAKLRATELDNRSLLAEINVLHGAIAIDSRQEATGYLRRAHALATAHGPPEVTFEAATRLLYTYSEDRHNPEDAGFFEEVAAELETTIQPTRTQLWLLHLNRGVRADRMGEYQLSFEHYNRALDFANRYQRAITLHNIALAAGSRGDTAAAIQYLTQGLGHISQEFGTSHSMANTFRRSLIDIYLARGDVEATWKLIGELERHHGAAPDLPLIIARVQLLEQNPEGLATANEVTVLLEDMYQHDQELAAGLNLHVGHPMFSEASVLQALEHKGNLQLSIDYHEMLSSTATLIGNLESAVRHAHVARELREANGASEPELEEVLLIEAAALIDRGQDHQAGRLLARVTSKAPGFRYRHARRNLQLGRIALHRKDSANAKKLLTLARDQLWDEFNSPEQVDYRQVTRLLQQIERDRPTTGAPH